MLHSELISLFKTKYIKYNVITRFYENGDFGSLNQLEFNSEKIGGNVDFWSKGWYSFYVWDYKNEKELLNVLCEPQEVEKINLSFKKIEELLIEYN